MLRMTQQLCKSNEICRMHVSPAVFVTTLANNRGKMHVHRA